MKTGTSPLSIHSTWFSLSTSSYWVPVLFAIKTRILILSPSCILLLWPLLLASCWGLSPFSLNPNRQLRLFRSTMLFGPVHITTTRQTKRIPSLWDSGISSYLFIPSLVSSYSGHLWDLCCTIRHRTYIQKRQSNLSLTRMRTMLPESPVCRSLNVCTKSSLIKRSRCISLGLLTLFVYDKSRLAWKHRH